MLLKKKSERASVCASLMRFLSGLLCIFLLSVAPSYAQSGTSAVGILDHVSLKLKWRHQFQFAGYYAALEKGFYRDAGLKVSIEELQTGEDSFSAVLSGKNEFGISGSDVVAERAKGKKLVALAAIYQHSPLVFLTPEKSGIQNIHQLADRRVMLEAHSAELQAYLLSEGISKDEFALFPHTYGIDKLIAGEIDVISAYSNDEPFLLKENGLAYRIFIPQSSGIDFYGDILYTTEDQVKYYPHRVKKFISASLKGWRYALENSEEIIDLILEKYSRRHSREHLLFEAEGAKKLILPEVVEIGYMNSGRWKHIIEKYQSLGMIDKEVDLKAFLYDSDPGKDSYLALAIQIVEVLIALLAIWFIVKFIRINISLEELDKKNRQVRKRLNKSQVRFSRLLANIPGIIFSCRYDESWTMLFVSKGCFELTGYYPEELEKNRLLSYSDLILPEDRQKVADAVKESFHLGKPFKITYRIRCRDNQIKWVWGQGKFLSEAVALKKMRIEGFITDITEFKELENGKNELEAQLQKALNELKKAKSLLPLCSSCEKIRDDEQYFQQVKNYLRDCPDEEDDFNRLCPVCSKNSEAGKNPAKDLEKIQ
ncbi:MAG: hypothetical protein PWR01_4065 [Clostridiales bacterium]|nr:hypothetical protein [Clostridiales bacterium]MDN5282992.1 hypothetical protein [Candidatus Ozemobacter sp.]